MKRFILDSVRACLGPLSCRGVYVPLRHRLPAVASTLSPEPSASAASPKATGENRGESYTAQVWREFQKNPLGKIGFFLVVILGAVALFAPFLAGDVPVYLVKDGTRYWFPNIISYAALRAENLYENFDRWEPKPGDYALYPLIRYSPLRQDLRARLKPPSREHWLGTDDRGRDVLSRLIWGTRISMSVGFVSVGIAVVIGIVLGALGGYYGGWVDAVVMRLIEIMLVFPTFFLVIAVMAFRPPGAWGIPVEQGATVHHGGAGERVERLPHHLFPSSAQLGEPCFRQRHLWYGGRDFDRSGTELFGFWDAAAYTELGRDAESITGLCGFRLVARSLSRFGRLRNGDRF